MAFICCLQGDQGNSFAVFLSQDHQPMCLLVLAVPETGVCSSFALSQSSGCPAAHSHRAQAPLCSAHRAFYTFHEKSNSRKSRTKRIYTPIHKKDFILLQLIFCKMGIAGSYGLRRQEQISQHVECNSKVTFFWNYKLWECFPSAPLSSVLLFPAGSTTAAEVIWPQRPFAHIRFCLSLYSAFASLATFSNCNYIKKL